ncbi:MAG: hypothetical protein NTV86_22905, partial [Planctomycetota bacterium]|nr:hypothetical protein [Planctomycetota bacterium]
AQMGQMIRADWPWQVTAARRGADAFNRPCVDFTLDAAGATWMSDLTGRYANPKVPGGAYLAILVDGQVCSAPRIMSPIAREGQITGRFTDKEVDDLIRLLTAPPASRPAATTETEALKGKLVQWVETFFRENYRDITARKTLEWGEPEVTADGDLAIRYKFLATIRDKDQMVIEQRFAFTPNGKYVSAETIEKGPATRPASAVRHAASRPVTVAGKEALKGKLVQWVEKFFSENYRDITARKTLEWGEPEVTAEGNLAIRYKFLATIWNKDQTIIDQRFTFSADGEYLSAETIEKAPATHPGSRPGEK